jgi:hypothetical protein
MRSRDGSGGEAVKPCRVSAASPVTIAPTAGTGRGAGPDSWACAAPGCGGMPGTAAPERLCVRSA